MNIVERNDNAIEVKEVSADRAATFLVKDPTKKYLLSCGDDRNMTDASADHLRSTFVDIDLADPNTAIRYYGGGIGIARITATVVAAQYGPRGLEQFGNDFVAFVSDNQQRVEATSGVVLTEHSAEGNEGNPDHIDEDSTNGLGCAYAANVGTVSLYNQDPDTASLAKHEAVALGVNEQLVMSTVAQANANVSDHFFVDNKAFGFTRKEYGLLQNMHDVILAGSHAHTTEAVVVVNFHADKVSNPQAANESGVPFYNNDVTQVAEMIMRAYPELNLDPKIILSVMLEDIAATRKALAAGDGLEAKDLKLEYYGNPAQAIEYLESIAA